MDLDQECLIDMIHAASTCFHIFRNVMQLCRPLIFIHLMTLPLHFVTQSPSTSAQFHFMLFNDSNYTGRSIRLVPTSMIATK